MSSTTVAEFASELKKSTETLLEQLTSAGVAKTAASDVLTDADKHKLLNHLQAAHGTAGAERKKITLVKKQTTEIKQADASGKARTIQVEVRKKRTFVKRDIPEGVPARPEAVAADTHDLAEPTPAHAEVAIAPDAAAAPTEVVDTLAPGEPSQPSVAADVTASASPAAVESVALAATEYPQPVAAEPMSAEPPALDAAAATSDEARGPMP
jgi:translation initiation factor IF-2